MTRLENGWPSGKDESDQAKPSKRFEHVTSYSLIIGFDSPWSFFSFWIFQFFFRTDLEWASFSTILFFLVACPFLWKLYKNGKYFTVVWWAGDSKVVTQDSLCWTEALGVSCNVF